MSQMDPSTEREASVILVQIWAHYVDQLRDNSTRVSLSSNELDVTSVYDKTESAYIVP